MQTNISTGSEMFINDLVILMPNCCKDIQAVKKS